MLAIAMRVASSIFCFLHFPGYCNFIYNFIYEIFVKKETKETLIENRGSDREIGFEWELNWEGKENGMEKREG